MRTAPKFLLLDAVACCIWNLQDLNWQMACVCPDREIYEGRVNKRIITIVITCYCPQEIAMQALKLIEIGNSVGVIFPKEIMTKLKLEKGDAVYVTETPDGIALTPYDPTFKDQMIMAREVMKDYRDVLRELAK
jgi:putative addiction module antidote